MVQAPNASILEFGVRLVGKFDRAPEPRRLGTRGREKLQMTPQTGVTEKSRLARPGPTSKSKQLAASQNSAVAVPVSLSRFEATPRDTHGPALTAQLLKSKILQPSPRHLDQQEPGPQTRSSMLHSSAAPATVRLDEVLPADFGGAGQRFVPRQRSVRHDSIDELTVDDGPIGPTPLGEASDTNVDQPERSGGMSVGIFAIAVAIIVLGVLVLPSPFQGRFNLRGQSSDIYSTDSDTSPLITRPPREASDLALSEGLTSRGFANIAGEVEVEARMNFAPAAPTADSEIVGPGTGSAPQTTTIQTTTTSSWVEPAVEPRAQWIDAGAGVALPEVLVKIRFCESTNDYTASNRSSSARGAYQFLSKSWKWYGHAALYGVPSANLASPAQQDQAALKTFEQDGARPWAASRDCWDDPNIVSSYRHVKPKSTPTTSEAPTTTSPDASTSTATSDTVSSSTTVGPATTTPSTVSTVAETTQASPTTATTTAPATTAKPGTTAPKPKPTTTAAMTTGPVDG